MPQEPNDEDLVLLAYDGSRHAVAAIEEAARQLRPRRALVLTVLEPLEAVPYRGAPFSAIPTEIAEDMWGRAQLVSEEGGKLAAAAGFEAETLVERGAPAWSRIIEVADERNASLIVLGSRGLTGLKQVLLGSVASAVAQHAERSVLLTHLPS